MKKTLDRLRRTCSYLVFLLVVLWDVFSTTFWSWLLLNKLPLPPLLALAVLLLGTAFFTVVSLILDHIQVKWDIRRDQLHYADPKKRVEKSLQAIGARELPVILTTRIECAAYGSLLYRPVVLLGEKLLNSSFSDRELQALLAHEISHLERHDTYKQWLVKLLSIEATLTAAFYSLMKNGNFFAAMGSVALLQIATHLFYQYNSRVAEYRADEYAARKLGKGGSEILISALVRYLQLCYPEMSPWESRSFWIELLHTHPSLQRRAQRLRRKVTG